MTIPPLTGPFLPLLVLIWPLLLGLVATIPQMRHDGLKLLPMAPLPALLLAFAGPGGEATLAPDLLLGVVLGLDANGALFLGFIAALWCLGGLFALGYMRKPERPAVFSAFWCLTLAGNLGVILARDAASFYVAFAAVSLAAYFLVVHDGTARALHAGRVYIVLAVIGEALLLVGLMAGIASADGMLIAEIRTGLSSGPMAGFAVACLIAGLGIKAGLVPLHIWLPLAHPAAPTPASAVLSGAIVKAGIVGMIQFLPEGTELWPLVLLALGLFGAYGAVIAGLGQKNPKAVLAYSTVSQMGLVIALIGAGHLAGNPGAAYGAAALYCAHHGLAKGALFMSVGVIGASGRKHLPLVLGLTAFAALSVAGLPLSGGALAKAAIKPSFAGLALFLVTASAVGTTLLLARFLTVVAGGHAEDADAKPTALVAGPWLALVAGAAVLPWVLLTRYSDLDAAYVLAPGALWDAGWPVALGIAIAGIGLRWWRRSFTVPEGDIAVPLTGWAGAAKARLSAIPEPVVPRFPAARAALPERAMIVERGLTALAPLCVALVAIIVLLGWGFGSL